MDPLFGNTTCWLIVTVDGLASQSQTVSIKGGRRKAGDGRDIAASTVVRSPIGGPGRDGRVNVCGDDYERRLRTTNKAPTSKTSALAPVAGSISGAMGGAPKHILAIPIPNSATPRVLVMFVIPGLPQIGFRQL